MEGYQAKELDYGITMAVNTLVTAMGMHAENQKRLHNGQEPAYNDSDFQDIIEENECHSNGAISRWLNVL